MKALALLSGGLDSMLAVKLLQEQGIEVEAVNFHTGFCSCGDTPSAKPSVKEGSQRGGCKQGAQAVAEQLNVKLHRINVAAEYIKEVVIDPRHGYGSQMNPCLDCRTFMMKKAGEMMNKIGASFLVSGEVLGQRPMTQHRHQMEMTEREAGVQGRVVRPLTAQNLPPSLPETNGWVDRDRLLNVSGRSRKEQFKLINEKGIKDFETPAGGCLLTDPSFSRRLRDLFAHEGKDALNIREVMLLRLGRHFRFPSGAKCIVGRRHEENVRLSMFRREDEALLDTPEVAGPSALLRGSTEPLDVERASGLTARYSDGPKGQPVCIRIRHQGSERTLSVMAMPDSALQPLRI